MGERGDNVCDFVETFVAQAKKKKKAFKKHKSRNRNKNNGLSLCISDQLNREKSVLYSLFLFSYIIILFKGY